MIFVTIGTQLPFDRLVSAVDQWALCQPDAEVFGQIGPSRLTPSFPHVAHLSGDAFEERMQAADMVVSHAGIGTIMTCWARRKPLIVMARQHALGEHRNDHQKSTVTRLREILRIAVAESGEHLCALLSTDPDALVPQTLGSGHGGRISDFVNKGMRPPPADAPLARGPHAEKPPAV